MGKASSVVLLVGVLGCCCWGAPTTPTPHTLNTNNPPTAILDPQDAGYILVNETSQAHLFYWYIPPRNGNSTAPVVLWLQGGPGASSVVDGLFLEHGPYYIDDSGNLAMRTISWSNEVGVIYVDQPVGTGFSYLEDESGYAHNETQVAAEMVQFLRGFFANHTSLQTNEFYVMGESYGGHFVPAIANAILDENQALRVSGKSQLVNFVGIAVGDGLVDPITQVTTKASAAYSFGLVDEITKEKLDQLAAQTVEAILSEDYDSALATRTQLEQEIVDQSGVNLMDIRTTQSYEPMQKKIISFLNSNATRSALNVGDHQFHTDPQVLQTLGPDRMRSYAFLFPRLLSELRVMLYQGQFDLKDGVCSNAAWVAKLQWPGASGFFNAPRLQWWVPANGSEEADIAGYVKSFDSLTEVVVRNAGHMSPMNRPWQCFSMLHNFVNNLPFNSTSLP